MAVKIDTRPFDDRAVEFLRRVVELEEELGILLSHQDDQGAFVVIGYGPEWSHIYEAWLMGADRKEFGA